MAAAVVAVLVALVAPGMAGSQQFPGVFTVTTTADGNDGECNNDCTLREAVSLATPDGSTSISLRPGVYQLTQGPLVLNSVTIIGPGTVGGQGAGARTAVIDARGRSRVIDVASGGSSIVAGVTITGGAADVGAGARVGSGAILSLLNVMVEGNAATSRGGGVAAIGTASFVGATVSGNRAPAGAGMSVEADGDAIVQISTFSGNTATGNGGGITSAGALVLSRATIAGNSAAAGGGIFQESAVGASISMSDTIVAGAAAGGACAGSIAGIPRGTFTRNIADDTTCVFASPSEGTVADPLLGALRNNGGPTDTRALRAGSPAIDAPGSFACGVDQRGAGAVGDCDIGAFEFGGQPPEVELPPPVAGETVNVGLSRGKVRIRLPGSDEYFDLKDSVQVPVGTTFDTIKGRVNFVPAGNQRSWFYDGVFKFKQTRGAKPLTTVTLTGRLNCGSGGASAAQKRKKKRRLWGNGKGKFRTKGRFSSATVRGTKWLVEDRCNGTLTRVKKGRVAVRYRGRTIKLRAGQQFFAKRRR